MPILGLTDTETFENDRFKNWRRVIRYAFPNGRAPLMAFLSMTDAVETNDPEFKWYEKSLPQHRTTLTAAYDDDDTSIAIADAVVRPGHIIRNNNTGEVMRVTAVSSDGLTLTVARGNWETPPAASSGSSDVIHVIGNANSENSGAPTAMYTKPTAQYNYTQIFRESFNVSGTEMKTAVIWDKRGSYPDKLAEALQSISMQMERAFLFGERAEYTNTSTGFVERTTRGLYRWIAAYNSGSNIFTPSGGNITHSLWDEYLEVAFRVSMNRANEKLVLMGSGFARHLNTLFRSTGRIELVPAEDTFGIDVTRYVSPHGTVYLKTSPLMTLDPAWRNWAFVVDLGCVTYRYLTGRDLQKLTNRQNNDVDGRKDEFLAECGLEVQHPEAMVVIRDVTGTA